MWVGVDIRARFAFHCIPNIVGPHNHMDIPEIGGLVDFKESHHPSQWKVRGCARLHTSQGVNQRRDVISDCNITFVPCSGCFRMGRVAVGVFSAEDA